MKKLYDGGFLFLCFLFVFGYGVSVLERSADDQGHVTHEAAKEVVDHDLDVVTDEASKAWANRQPIDYSKLND